LSERHSNRKFIYDPDVRRDPRYIPVREGTLSELACDMVAAKLSAR